MEVYDGVLTGEARRTSSPMLKYSLEYTAQLS